MSVINALLNSPDDLSQYTPIQNYISGMNGSGAFQTILNVTGKGGLLGYKITMSAASTIELKVTIDGSVWTWLSLSFNAGYISGILDIDDFSTDKVSRSINGVSGSSVLGGNFMMTPNTGATSAVAGIMFIRQPVLFNSSIKVEAKWNSGLSLTSVLYGYYK